MSKELYKLYCIDERRVVYKWTDTPPTVCPNNTVHDIDLDSVRISEKYNDRVIAEEISKGYFESQHIPMNIPSGTPGDITEHDVTWPMVILLWKTYLTPTTDMIGDFISVLAAPETTVGTLTATTPTLFGFAVGVPVKISIYVLKDIYIADTNIIDIGAKGFRGKQVTAGMILRIYYTNNSGTQKTYRWRCELYNIG